MRLVTIADLHLHYWKAFSTGHNAHGSRFQRSLQVLRDSLQAARQFECPWLFAGDWVHTIGWAHNGILTHLIKVLREFDDVEKVTVWGNHDSRSHGDEVKRAETIVEVLAQSVPNLTLLNGGLYKAKNGLWIWGQGYQPDRKYLSIPETFPGTLLREVHIGLFHQTVSGSKLVSGLALNNSVSGLTQEELWKQFRLSICGDVHHPQAFIKDDHVILVPGSPEHHNFGDTGIHGWWICEIEDNGTRCLQQPGGSPDFITVETIDQAKEDGNFYRVLTPCDPKLYQNRMVTVVAPPPTTIPERSLIKEGADVREILAAWLSLSPDITNVDEYLEAGLGLLVDEGLVTMRPTKLKKVSLEGFMCFAKDEFEIEDGVILVTGEARDYESNGAGKTTLFESIFWALFGRTTKGVGSDDVIQYGAREARVVLTIEDLTTNNEIVVCRTRVRGESGQLSVSSPEEWGGGAAELTKALGKYLGITPDLFQALSYFSQSKLVLFSQASDAERKSMLSDLCGLGVFTAASQRARLRGGESASLEATLDQKLTGIQESLDHTQKLIDDGILRQVAWDSERAVSVEALRSELGQLERELPYLHSQLTMALNSIDLKYKDQFAAIEAARITRKKEIEQDAKEQIERVGEEYKAILSVTPEEAQGGSDQWKSEVVATSAKISECRVKESQIRTQWETVRNDLDVARSLTGKCPTCGQPISAEFSHSHMNQLQTKYDELKERLDEVSTEWSGLRVWAERCTMLYNTATMLEDATRDRDRRLDLLTRRLESAEQAVGAEIGTTLLNLRHKKELEEREARFGIEMLQKTNVDRQAEITSRLEELAKAVNPYVELIQQSRDRAAILENLISETSAKIGFSRKQTMILGYWAKGFSRSGVQSILLESVAASFNQIRSRIFPLLTRGIYDVQFSTTSTTSEGEAREKTDFIIRDRDALVTYESLSGGQRRRIDLGVMLTLALAVSVTRRVPGVLGLMILDEVFGFLDSDGVEALYETLGEVEKVIPSIYAITHDPDLQSLFSHTMLVRQDEHGVSQLAKQPLVGE